jgi:hypothetical protein
MQTLWKTVFLALAALLAQASLAAETPVPACLAYATAHGPRCRAEAAVARVEDKFFVWGGKETLGCVTCDRRHQGLSSGGLYDADGALVEALPTADGPGARFGAQALWNRQALFVWGGIRRLDERRLEDGTYETRGTDVASTNSYYIPGIRRWFRMSVTDAPPLVDRTDTRDDGTAWKVTASVLELSPTSRAQACWTETKDGTPAETQSFCRAFDMPTNSWGPKVGR